MTLQRALKAPTLWLIQMANLGHWTSFSQIIANLAVVGGVAVALFGYFDAIQTRRVDRTLELVRRLEDEPFGLARRTISETLQEHAAAIQNLSKGGTPDEASYRIMSLGLVKDTRGGKGLSKEIDTIVNYFNEVQVCITMSVCDANVAHRFLNAYAEGIWTNFSPYIQEHRSLVPGYGGCLEVFLFEKAASGTCL